MPNPGGKTLYLPSVIDQAKVLITVKAYPKPSSRYDELVCTAGLLDGNKWIRIYPVPFRFIGNNQKYPKYSWINVDLVRTAGDFRPESYRPKLGLDEDFNIGAKLGTDDSWAARKSFVMQEVFLSMNEIIDLAYGDMRKSLATLKPKEIIDFEIEETTREWKEKWQNTALQSSFEDLNKSREAIQRDLVNKVPYNYYYHFITEGDDKPRRLKIEDWEIGALYWNCLRRTNFDEVAANLLVKNMYWDNFVNNKELYFFLGTTLQFHSIHAPNPFIIIGVFYPQKSDQLSLFQTSS